jgi:hypothetical protein
VGQGFVVLEGSVPDWAIILISAFGGGLAGAILQPAAQYLFDRLRSKDEIRRRRERQLRRMLRAQTAWGQKLIAAATLFRLRDELGQPLSPQERAAILELPHSAPAWEPQRIGDKQLQQDARDCYALALELYAVVTMGVPDSARLRQTMERIAQLDTQIVARMDELNWPEVDD